MAWFAWSGIVVAVTGADLVRPLRLGAEPLGTVLAAQVPYAIAFGLSWKLLLLRWVAMGWSLGPGA